MHARIEHRRERRSVLEGFESRKQRFAQVLKEQRLTPPHINKQKLQNYRPSRV